MDGLLIVWGIVGLAFGFVAFAWPGITIAVLGACAMAGGVVLIALGVGLRSKLTAVLA